MGLPSQPDILQSTILVVDDHSTNLKVIAGTLKEEGFRILVSQDGESALVRANDALPDLILLDVMLPGMNGFETCKQLKVNERTHSIPIIFMTSLTDTHDKINGFKAGAVDYITKPIRGQELIMRVKTHLTIHQIEQKLKLRNEQLEREIQERQEAERQLAQLTTRYELILHAAGEGIYGTDLHGQVTFLNPAALALLGYQLDDLIGQNAHSIIHHTKDDGTPYPVEDCPIYAAFKDGSVHRAEDEVFWKKDGQSIPIHYISTPVRDSGGELVGAVIIFHDISERKQTEKLIQQTQEELEQRVIERTNELTQSLQEKDTLLKEIHHRVKNNLQVISSLLSLQADQLEYTSAEEAFLECRHRVKAMALVHEQLYGNQTLNRLDSTQYFHDLVTNLVASYRAQGEPIAFTIQATGISLELDKAIPCGLIVTELVSNCLKYAFPGNMQGHITIGIAKNSDQQYRLWVQDTGIGFPKDLDYRTLKSLGLQLVINLSEHQLGGTFTMNSTKGTTMTVTFPMGE